MPPLEAEGERRSVSSATAAGRQALFALLLLLLLAADGFVAAATSGRMDRLREETLYRGFLQGRLEAWLGRWLGYLATALLFTTTHLHNQCRDS